MREMVYAIIILVMAFFCIAIVLASCISYRKWKREQADLEKQLAWEKQKSNSGVISSREMTPEELEVFLHTFNKEEDSEKDFVQWVQDYLNTDHSKDEPLRVEPIVEVTAKCDGYNCSCSPNREDCCTQFGADGLCHFYINLNKAVGIEDVKRDPSILTPQEVNELANALEKYQKLQDSQNKAHN